MKLPEQCEPNRFEIYASYKSERNTVLARRLHCLMSFGQYDRHSAHRWALKLIAGNPANGREAAAVLTNYNWMVEGAVAQYDKAPRETRRYDDVAAVFAAWKAKDETAA